jgi:hypothetical protein
MTDVTVHLHTAVVGDEPPIGFTPADIIITARRARRRRRISAVVTAGAATAVAAGVVLALPGGTVGSAPGSRAPALSLTALTRTAATRPAGTDAAPGSVHVDGISAAKVIALAEKVAGARLTSVQASILPPSGELDLAAALAVAGSPYIDIQVTPPHSLSTATPTCAALSDAATGTGDGYYGPCSVQRLGDGSLLIARSGRTTTGTSSMAQAILIRPDGSGVFAEDTNLAVPTRQEVAKLKAGGRKTLSAARKVPPVNAATLASLVRDIASSAQS